MELEIVDYIYIDVDGIIEEHGLNANSSKKEIYDAIHDYACGLDDCEYYAIGDEEVEKIAAEIRSRVGKQESLFEDA